MLSQKEIWEIARKQSALDLNCAPEDFLKTEPVLCGGCLGPGAKKYYREPIACNFVSYGCNVVASAQEAYRDIAGEYIRKFPFYHCFETPNLHWLNDRLEPLGQRVCFMAEYFLPRPEAVRPLPCAYSLRVLEPQDFSHLYLPQWSNALCEKRKELDVLAKLSEMLLDIAAQLGQMDGSIDDHEGNAYARAFVDLLTRRWEAITAPDAQA